MSLGQKILTLTVVYLLAFVFATGVFLISLVRVLINGKKFFHVKSRQIPPACLTDQELGQHKYIVLKDVKIHYVEAGDSTKPLMLFVHGFPEFWFSWRHQIKEFKKDYWVVAIDLRGYGDSDKPSKTSAYQMSNFVSDIQEIIQGLGRKSCVLVAHDWGGAIAWSFAATHPEMVDKLVVLNCPHPKAFRKHLRSSFKQLFMSWYIFVFQIPYLPEIYLRANDLDFFDKLFRQPNLGFTQDEIEAYKYTFAKRGAFTPPINYYRNVFVDNRGLLSSTGKKLSVPSLIIWGTEDLALHTAMATLSAEYVENCQVKLVPGASHWLQQDSPKVVNNHMRDFLTDERSLRGRMRHMRRNLMSSVSGAFNWSGVLGCRGKLVKTGNFVVKTAGKHILLSSFSILYRLSGSPLQGAWSVIMFI